MDGNDTWNGFYLGNTAAFYREFYRESMAVMLESFNVSTEGWNTSVFGDNPSVEPVLSTDSVRRMASYSIASCSALGLLSVFLNLYVIISLLNNRRRVLKNVFYVIVLNCAVVDVVRGGCLMTYGAAQAVLARKNSNGTMVFPPEYYRVFAFTNMVLRECNIVTIFNLLVFTTNEFIVIRYPLHYRRYCRRRILVLVLMSCWALTVLFGFVDVHLTRSKGSFMSIGLSQIPLIIVILFCYSCLFIVLLCYGVILLTIRRFHAVEKAGSAFHSLESHRIHKGCEQCAGHKGSRRCNSHRKWRTHLMSRHKYLIVIGSVLLVDILFLIPYSCVQMIPLLIRYTGTFNEYQLTFKWTMQILIGVHSVCQPLCYFRMTEFRRLACCYDRRSWLLKSKSFSAHKSFGGLDGDRRTSPASTRSHREELQLLEKDSPRPRETLLEHTRMVLAPLNPHWTPTVSFRTYRNQASKLGANHDLASPACETTLSEGTFE